MPADKPLCKQSTCPWTNLQPPPPPAVPPERLQCKMHLLVVVFLQAGTAWTKEVLPWSSRTKSTFIPSEFRQRSAISIYWRGRGGGFSANNLLVYFHTLICSTITTLMKHLIAPCLDVKWVRLKTNVEFFSDDCMLSLLQCVSSPSITFGLRWLCRQKIITRRGCTLHKREQLCEGGHTGSGGHKRLDPTSTRPLAWRECERPRQPDYSRPADLLRTRPGLKDQIVSAILLSSWTFERRLLPRCKNHQHLPKPSNPWNWIVGHSKYKWIKKFKKTRHPSRRNCQIGLKS